MYIIHGIGNNYIVKLNNKLLNLPHLKDLYKIEVFNFMFKFILFLNCIIKSDKYINKKDTYDILS